jgi:hypothetical protein
LARVDLALVLTKLRMKGSGEIAPLTRVDLALVLTKLRVR